MAYPNPTRTSPGNITTHPAAIVTGLCSTANVSDAFADTFFTVFQSKKKKKNHTGNNYHLNVRTNKCQAVVGTINVRKHEAEKPVGQICSSPKVKK